jgi:hypothetical protein
MRAASDGQPRSAASIVPTCTTSSSNWDCPHLTQCATGEWYEGAIRHVLGSHRDYCGIRIFRYRSACGDALMKTLGHWALGLGGFALLALMLFIVALICAPFVILYRVFDIRPRYHR